MTVVTDGTTTLSGDLFYTWSGWRWNDGYYSSWNQSTPLGKMLSSSKAREWVRTPGFATLVKTKQRLPDNGYSYKEIKRVDELCRTVEYRWQYRPYTPNEFYEVRSYPMRRTISPPQVPLTADFGAVKSLLISRAKGSSFQAPVFFAEFRKTSDMVVDSANRFVRMALALRRGRFDRFVELAHPTSLRKVTPLQSSFRKAYKDDPQSAAASYWLQLRYGYLPFMMEVQSAVNTALDLMDLPDARQFRVTARERSSHQAVDRNYPVEVTPSVRAVKHTWTETTTRGVWIFEPKPENIPGRFGLLNPAEVVWELVPLSFVADWFIPIGDYISHLDVDQRFTHVGGAFGYRVSKRELFEVYNHGYWREASGRLDQTTVLVERYPMRSAPVLDVTDLRWKPSMNAKRVVDSIALLRNILVGLKPRR